MNAAIDTLKEKVKTIRMFIDIDNKHLNENTFPETKKERIKHLKYMRKVERECKQAIKLIIMAQKVK